MRNIFAVTGWALLAIIVVCTAASARAAPKQTVIHNFSPAPEGIVPQSALVLDSSGVLYGTTTFGGEAGLGAVFKLTPPTMGHTVWTESVIYSFKKDSDGSGKWSNGGLPTMALTPDGSGGFFGTTSGGGVFYSGTIFRLTPPGSGKTVWTETTLYSFNSSDKGLANTPLGPLVLDSNGALYGALGDAEGHLAGGIVFKLAPPTSTGGAWAFETLHIFSKGGDGLSPSGPLVVDKGGTIYGVTRGGGSLSKGTFFQLAPPAKGGSAWVEKILHNFGTGDSDVASPTNGLVQASNGVLYGTGTSTSGGSVFKMTPPISSQANWVETTLSAIIDSHGVVGVANAPVAIDGDGALYGTALYHTKEGSPTFVFKLLPPAHAGDAWTATELSAFNGFVASAGLVRDAKGILYGTALPFNNGTAQNQGIVFDVVPPPAGQGLWTQHTLNTFLTTDGDMPEAALVADREGNLYGTTLLGGLYGFGTVFKLAHPTGQHPAWTETILHSFNGTDGNSPEAPLIIDAQGAIYGTTIFGGSVNLSGGIVFKLTPPAKRGIAWSETVLESFYKNEYPKSAGFTGSLVMDKSGAVYGIISVGGKYGTGQVFKLISLNSKNTVWSEIGIYDLPPSGLGYFLNPGLAIDSSGNLYMTTRAYASSQAAALKLVPPSNAGGNWTPVVLYRFAAGDTPDSPAMAAGSGALFGTSYSGGAYGKGFVYELMPPPSPNTQWIETTLHSFGKGSDAIEPFETVSFDKSGAVYGTALSNYYANTALVFKLTPPSSSMAGWTESILGQYTFDSNVFPEWGIHVAPNGTIYGTTVQGGPASAGTVFQITQ